MKRRTGFLLSALVLLSVIDAKAADSVKIGAVYALTGPGAVAGGDGMRGTELAIAEINAAGGLKNHGGVQIELVKGDSQSKPVNAVGETERLINQDKVALIIGAGTSNETIPLSQVAEKYGIPHINAIPQQESLSNGSLKWTWSTTLIDGDYVAGIFRALDMVHQINPKLTNVAVLCPDNEYGIEMGKQLKVELAKRKDLTVTSFIDYGASAQDLLQPVLKLKASQPAVVIQVGYFRAGVLVSKAYEQLDFHPVVIGTGGMSGDPKLRPEIGNLVAWQFAVTPFSADLPAARKTARCLRKEIPAAAHPEFGTRLFRNAGGDQGARRRQELHAGGHCGCIAQGEGRQGRDDHLVRLSRIRRKRPQQGSRYHGDAVPGRQAGDGVAT